MAERKRAYRYEVIDHGGEGTKAIGDSPTILDWKYLGKEYTWNIVRGPRFESLGLSLREELGIYKRYVEQNRQRLALCAVTCNCGPNGEPLACGYEVAHGGDHSWGTLTTFAVARG